MSLKLVCVLIDDGLRQQMALWADMIFGRVSPDDDLDDF